MRTEEKFPRWWSVIVGVTVAALIGGVYAALLWAPTERTMGTVQRIFYYHVSSAWTAFVAYFVTLVASLAYLRRRQLTWDAAAVSAAELGVLFNTVNLITGPIWAKPVWGIWWTWDARLTSTFVMWLLYVSYLLLRQFTAESPNQRVLAAVFAIFAFVDVPIVYLSIRLWRTQHPGPVIAGGEGSGIDPQMFLALHACFGAFLLLFVTLFYWRYRLERERVELETLRARLRYLAAQRGE
ncbi:MAG TPA: cytochrome c biogenesis protein CcsA [Blastocatellia bacterium]|nr:cytochrome c biogenesis protein CcsA [Blastocatellia bacterium]